MLKLFIMFMSLAMLFSPAQLREIKENSMFYAYNDGYQIEITQKDSENLEQLLKDCLKGAHKMPALGVSLHEETLNAVQSGIWLRFKLDRTCEVDGMSFDELLLQINKNMYGANVIRGNDGRYEGRCFYIDFENNCDKLYDYLIKLPTTQNKFETSLPSVQDGQSVLIIDFLNEDDKILNRGRHSIPLTRAK